MKLEIIAKCNDCCSVNVTDTDLSSHGNVPRNIGIGGGDYIHKTYTCQISTSDFSANDANKKAVYYSLTLPIGLMTVPMNGGKWVVMVLFGLVSCFA